MSDEIVRVESGPVARLTKLGNVLSGPIERKKNQSNKHNALLFIPMSCVYIGKVSQNQLTPEMFGIMKKLVLKT